MCALANIKFHPNGLPIESRVTVVDGKPAPQFGWRTHGSAVGDLGNSRSHVIAGGHSGGGGLHAEQSWRVLLLSALLSLLCGMLFGLAPASQSARLDLVGAIKETQSAKVRSGHSLWAIRWGRSTTRRRRSSWGQALTFWRPFPPVRPRADRGDDAERDAVERCCFPGGLVARERIQWHCATTPASVPLEQTISRVRGDHLDPGCLFRATSRR